LHASTQTSAPNGSAMADSPTLSEHGSVQGDPLERITSPLPVNRATPPPPPPAPLGAYRDATELAVSRLNEAAQRIAEDEPGKSDRKVRPYSRASRLAPIRDISADIRRESTPLPQVSKTQENAQGSKNGPGRQSSKRNSPTNLDAGPGLPDLWPWLDSDTEDKENDTWEDETDPLTLRHFPNSAESARIEEEDIRRALAEGKPTIQFPILQFPILRKYFHTPRMRVIFMALVIFAVVTLAANGILLSLAIIHSHNPDSRSGSGGPPTLTLSSNVAYLGQSVQLILQHFPPGAHVDLTHDIQEPINLTSSPAGNIINVGSKGFITVPVVVSSDWGLGFHLIVAEDVTTHDTASATLQVMGKGQTRPPRLLLEKNSLDLGVDVVGANTIYSFKLKNSGDGSITWSGGSHQSWLLIAPTQGTFSQDQTISIAVQRASLKPGDYKGTISFTSNVGAPQQVQVEMVVRPLPANAGSVLVLTPALLSFTTTDGEPPNPGSQTLTMSNPGSRMLNWSLATNDQATATTQVSLLHALGPNANWLSTNITSGIVPPGAIRTIQVTVNSQHLLPGAYIGTLTFSAPGAYDSPQSVNVSITVQPHCGIVTSLGGMSFIAVQGQSNPANRSLSLNATSSCAGASINWTASSTAPWWLSVTPASGQLRGTTSAVVSISVNTANLAPKIYYGSITFFSGQSTQTVMVQLIVQAPPSPAEPIMAASPLTLNFSNTQGQPNPTGQVVTITNNGGSALKWNTTATQFSTTWLNATPTGGSINPGQTGQVTIGVDTSKLTPGNYVGQVVLGGMDSKGSSAAGSGQTITINLVVQPPCALSPPSSSSLSFSAVQGGLSPAQQTVTFTGTGSCVWPLTWNTSVAPAASWLSLTPSGPTIKGTGQSGSIGVTATIAGLTAGTYTAQITISAADGSGAAAQGSPQKFSATLTVLPPCTLSNLPASLSFSVPQGSTTATAQNVTLSETGTCARPVSWTATTDAGSSSWLFPTASGTDSGGGSTLAVNVNPTSMIPGSYSGLITITATDSSNVAVSGSPKTITVSLTVTGFTISGSVVGCAGPDPSCATSVPLPGATVALMSGTTTIATTVADASGNYSFSGIALGPYTISVGGTDASNTHYVGSATLTVSGNTPGFTIQAFPG
jgi:hypothetical protein